MTDLLTSTIAREQRIELTHQLGLEHEGHENFHYAYECRFCIYKASMDVQEDRAGKGIAMRFLSGHEIDVINGAICDVDFALDMKGLVMPFKSVNEYRY